MYKDYLCDAGRVLRWLDVERLAAQEDEAEDAAAADAPDNLEIAVCELAHRFGTSPQAVMGWPVEAVVAAMRVAATVRDAAAQPAQRGEEVSLDEFLQMTRGFNPGG